MAEIRDKYKPTPTKHYRAELVRVWTDGSCNNRGPKDRDIHPDTPRGTNGSYGIVIRYECGNERHFIGPRYDQSTSGRMELLGAIKALEKIDPQSRVLLHCDNQYVVNLLAKDWLKTWDLTNNELKNIDLLRRLERVVKSFRTGTIKFIWVRGHNGNEQNERCDQLAGTGAKKEEYLIDTRSF